MKATDSEIMRKALNEMDFNNSLELRQGAVTFDNPVSIGLRGAKLEEGLIHTYPIDTTLRYIKEYFGLSDSEIYKGDGENGYERIFVRMYNDGHNKKIMGKAMSLCGYYPAHFTDTLDGYVVIQYESKHDENISEELRKTERFLTHITPTYNVEKILKNGFSPKSKNYVFNFPDRVYFSVGSTIPQESLELVKMLAFTNASAGNDGKYSVLKVDLTKIPEGVKFFKDQNYKNGVYTTENIRPDCIVGKVDIDVNKLK